MIWLCSVLIFGASALADDDLSQLVSVIVLFRHGARAPTDRISNASHREFFSNGLGELTNIGIEHSYDLGRFLQKRYVNNGFLRSPLLPSEVYFRSRAINRCLMSASLVGSGMFDVNGTSNRPVVPIYSQEKNDMSRNKSITESILQLLSSRSNCTAEVKVVFNMCGRTFGRSYKNFVEYQGFIFECLGLQNTSEAFHDGKSFEVIDSLITEYQNGLPMSDWFERHKKEIFENFVKVENLITGVAEYHDVSMLRIKSGHLLYTVFEQLKSNWQQFLESNSVKKRKFIAYSTQDWVMYAFLESLGIREFAINDNSLPKYNSLIIIELRKLSDMPVVKVFFRDPTEETLKDVTFAIRGCNSSNHCPLQLLLNCCNSYLTANPLQECYPEAN
ncbi:histidine acid phosphatase [Dictyocaulus viviparus]|uniref:Histidine acid phosphatase n=1 Tax=Dictyocaulus viviparus TaxID=29172 RepID=A0A0D8X9N4_DICVI|nr:histidine acid phosphatase [Dictyocaulus viviparus]